MPQSFFNPLIGLVEEEKKEVHRKMLMFPEPTAVDGLKLEALKRIKLISQSRKFTLTNLKF